MRIAAIVPIHGFTQLIADTCRWCEESYPKLFDAYRVFLICDDPDSAYALQGLKNDDIIVETTPTRNSLKGSLIRGVALARLFEADVTNIIEADAVPRFTTLAAMTRAFETLPMTGAVSPLYDWQGEICYPCHPHWFTDPLIDANYPGVGEVRGVGECGIPFLFSLWKPEALDVICRHESALPEVYQLDGSIGRLVVQEGLRFYRLINHSAGHFNGGRNG
jgi:hypothetical protein